MRQQLNEKVTTFQPQPSHSLDFSESVANQRFITKLDTAQTPAGNWGLT